jgi:hypothetical protein
MDTVSYLSSEADSVQKTSHSKNDGYLLIVSDQIPMIRSSGGLWALHFGRTTFGRVRATGSVHTKMAEVCTHAITSAAAPSCELVYTANLFHLNRRQRCSQHAARLRQRQLPAHKTATDGSTRPAFKKGRSGGPGLERLPLGDEIVRVT